LYGTPETLGNLHSGPVPGVPRKRVPDRVFWVFWETPETCIPDGILDPGMSLSGGSPGSLSGVARMHIPGTPETCIPDDIRDPGMSLSGGSPGSLSGVVGMHIPGFRECGYRGAVMSCHACYCHVALCNLHTLRDIEYAYFTTRTRSVQRGMRGRL